MKKFTCLLLTLIGIPSLWACYNETHVNKYGQTTKRSSPGDAYYNEPDRSAAAEYLKGFDLSNVQKYDKDIQSDIAVELAYLGKLQESLVILRRLQKSYPNDYNIAANLGTTYELTGKNDSALFFIKKGMQLNPDSHDGTEWVHVKILEAKLNLAKDTNWLASHRVLNTGISFDSKPSDLFYEKASDVEYQLHERIPFTPFPDKIMGNVFDELGDLYATQQSIEFAYVAYDFSLQYDPADKYGVKEKMRQLRPLLIKAGIPVPSWRDNYLSRTGKKILNAAADIAEKQLTNKDNLDKINKSASSIWDAFSGEKQRRQRERTWMIGIAALLVVSLAVFIVYRKKK